MRHLRQSNSGPVRTLNLARPELENALDERLIGELTEAVSQAAHDPTVRVIVLRGDGASFCAGGDRNMIREIVESRFVDSADSIRRLATMYHSLAHCPQPVVAVAQGTVSGAGAGLVCACDIAIGHRDATVCFNAVRLGTVAATAAPFVERRMGCSEALHLALTARTMDGQEAYRRGFFHYLTDDLDSTLQEVLSSLLLGSPQAQAAAKRVYHQLPRIAEQDLIEWGARETALTCRTDEGIEGLKALLEGRPPEWQLE
jgi:methylglutaconyl-CoA hydratase